MNFELNNDILEEMESLAYTEPGSREKDWLSKAVLCIRDLQHQLRDPNFIYAGERIYRVSKRRTHGSSRGSKKCTD